MIPVFGFAIAALPGIYIARKLNLQRRWIDTGIVLFVVLIFVAGWMLNA